MILSKFISKKIILIGGTAYTGEIKKGIFSALNFILPHEKNVLAMHCSANVGKEGDTAIFFGLSGVWWSGSNAKEIALCYKGYNFK